MAEEKEWTKESLVDFLKPKHPILAEFAATLIDEETYGEEETAALLTEEWDGAYPGGFIGDDINNDISNFLYNMAHFCLQKAKQKTKYDERLEGYLNIYVVPSYEDVSYILICDYNTETTVAKCSEKTWYFKPEVLEETLGGLTESIERGIKLVRSRDTDSILARASKHLEKAEKMLTAMGPCGETEERMSAIISDIKGIQYAMQDMVGKQQ
ncbi:MAG: hypothetical protein ABSE82_05975 [Nitrososphaerales archaeon]|jgi:hypothetical protein